MKLVVSCTMGSKSTSSITMKHVLISFEESESSCGVFQGRDMRFIISLGALPQNHREDARLPPNQSVDGVHPEKKIICVYGGIG